MKTETDYIGYTSGRKNVSSSSSSDLTTNEQFDKSLDGSSNGDGSGDGGGGSNNKYWAVALIFFPILTIFGNSLVVLSVIKEKNLRTVTNYFVVSLAIADLTVSAAVMPIAVLYEVIELFFRFFN